jgi:hypothetical protein
MGMYSGPAQRLGGALGVAPHMASVFAGERVRVFWGEREAMLWGRVSAWSLSELSHLASV